MLLGFPAHQLARLLFLDPLDLSFLDDHIAAADGGHDLLRLDAGTVQGGLDGLGDHAGVHDLALDDRVLHYRLDRDLRELRPLLRMIDNSHLDQTGADIEPDSRAFATEQCHWWETGDWR